MRTKKTKNGITIITETNEDLYYLNLLIKKNDEVKKTSYRKIRIGKKEEYVKKKFNIKIKVINTEFRKNPFSLRIKGTITDSENEEIPNNSHHSFIIREGDEITLIKNLTKFDEEIINKAKKRTKFGKTLMIITDYGEARFATLTNTIHEIGVYQENTSSENIKEKEQLREKFVKNLIKKIKQVVEETKPALIIIGAEGFLDEKIRKLTPKEWIITKVNSTTRNGFQELINNGAVKKGMEEHYISEETKEVNSFLAKMSKGTKATYGEKQVLNALKMGAVEKLIITDEKLMEAKGIELIKMAEQQGGEITIISTSHEAGEKLKKIGGVGAILRYEIRTTTL